MRRESYRNVKYYDWPGPAESAIKTPVVNESENSVASYAEQTRITNCVGVHDRRSTRLRLDVKMKLHAPLINDVNQANDSVENLSLGFIRLFDG